MQSHKKGFLEYVINLQKAFLLCTYEVDTRNRTHINMHLYFIEMLLLLRGGGCYVYKKREKKINMEIGSEYYQCFACTK